MEQDYRIRFNPLDEYHEAFIVPLNDAMFEQTDNCWWAEPWIDTGRAVAEIDRYWQWRTCEVEFDDEPMEALKVGLIAGDQVVQGAMIITVDPVASALEPGRGALLVEWLFTAPRNRPYLRSDGDTDDQGRRRPLRWYTSVGSELLKWAAALSRSKGYDGRIRLDASPDFVVWYAQRFFRRLPLPLVSHEGVNYTPMELPAAMVDALLDRPGREKGLIP